MIAVQQRPPASDGSDDLAAYRDPELDAMMDKYLVETAESHQVAMRPAQTMAGAISYLGANMNRRFDAVDRRFDAVDQRFEAVDRRFDAVDRRFDAMDQRFDAMDQRFERLEGKVGSMDTTLRLMLDEIKVISARQERMSAWIGQNERKV